MHDALSLWNRFGMVFSSELFGKMKEDEKGKMSCAEHVFEHVVSTIPVNRSNRINRIYVHLIPDAFIGSK